MRPSAESMTAPAAALVVAALLGGIEGAVLATVAFGACRVLGRMIPAVAGLALLVLGAVLTLIEGELVASLAYAADRALAARATTAGVAVLLGVVAVLPASGGRGETHRPAAPVRAWFTSARYRARVRRHGAAAAAAAFAGVGAVVFRAGRIPADVALAADRLVGGARPGDALDVVSDRSATSIGSVMMTAHGPIGPTGIAALFLAAGAAVIVASRPGGDGAVARTAVVPVALVLAAATAGDLADTMAVGLIAVAVGIHRVPGPAGALGAGLVVGFAGLCRPEALLVALALAASALIGDRRRGWAAAATVASASVIAFAWFSWLSENVTVDWGAGFRPVTVVLVAVPFVLACIMDQAPREVR